MALAFAAGLWSSAWLLPQALSPRSGKLPYADAPLPPLAEAWQVTEAQFFGPLPEAEVRMRGAIRGMIETLEDPYTVLLEPQPAQEEQQRLSGRYGDVGLSLWWASEGHIGLSPYPDGPAALAGVQKGDHLLRIDGNAVTTTQSLGELAWRLQGEVGTTVTLALLRPPGRALTFTITRDEVLHPSIQWRIVENHPTTGYLRIAMFTDQTADEVRQALDALQQRGMLSLVLDLRGNGGGVVAPLRSTLGAFLPRGSIVYHEIRQRTEEAVKTQGSQAFGGPLAILIDGSTASASEIFVAALRDHERAHLIGQPTFGKGSMQALYPLPDGSTLHVTNAIWLSPQHQRLDGAGLAPDLTVEPQSGKDAALEAALAYLQAVGQQDDGRIH